ncbi:PREDICTED: putative uncharacterized protein DDB_G0290521 [Camelina sativa]|uniref:Uncharacterized protein n=1 Tax=Camelina sativa TaxID=90675 RepID=A0ABM0WNY8_CAMSA|nr:PREDICTED: putative uncharacterized protein DDB_G0290521 [Camelina sativa]
MAGVKKRGGGRRNPSNRTSGTSQTPNRRPSNLPSKYAFTPANQRDPDTDSQGIPVPILHPPVRPTPIYRDYPPPTNLFQNPSQIRGASPSSESPIRRSFVQPLASPSNTPEFTGELRESPHPSVTNQPRQSPQVSNLRRESPQVSNLRRESPHVSNHRPPSSQPRPASASHHSSQAQNSHEEDEAGSEDDGLRQSSLPADVLAQLHDMLVQPGRELYTIVLSPTLERGTTW